MALVTAMALLAASASAVPAKAAPIDALAEIRADVTRLDLNAAAAKYDAEVIARLPQAQAGKPDPLLECWSNMRRVLVTCVTMPASSIAS